MGLYTNICNHIITVVLMCQCVTSQWQNYPSPDTKEYCENDKFEASCNFDEVIVIKEAYFGRMRRANGKCIDRGDTDPTCSISVRRLLDAQCSGRRECSLVVAALFQESSPPECTSRLRGFMEASYECVNVAYADAEYCTGALETKGQSGYLSSLVASENRCGTLTSPWFVTVNPGQRIRFNLMDFGQEPPKSSTVTRVCHVLATLNEERISKSETVCASLQRETMVYESTYNMVKVRLVGTTQDGKGKNFFLLKYEAIGCADIVKPAHGWVHRVGDEVTLGCNYTNKAPSKLTCIDNQWHGTYENCTSPLELPAASTSDKTWGLFSKSHGVSVFVVVCIALLVGLIILAVGLVYLRRRAKFHHRRTELPPAAYMDEQTYQSRLKTGQYDGMNSQNDYYKTYQLQRHQQMASRTGPGIPLPPPPPYSDRSRTVAPNLDMSSGSSNTYSDYQKRRVDHIYESPKFLRKDYGTDDSRVATPSEYYELDPSVDPPTPGGQRI